MTLDEFKMQMEKNVAEFKAAMMKSLEEAVKSDLDPNICMRIVEVTMENLGEN